MGRVPKHSPATAGTELVEYQGAMHRLSATYKSSASPGAGLIMLAGWAEPEQTRPLVQLREDPEGFRMSIGYEGGF